MPSGVYHIVNKINNHSYIGSSLNLQGRMSGHFKNLSRNKHGNKHLQCAINKYGIDNFESKVLLICDKDMLVYFEQKCIDNLKPEYNISHVVGPGFFRGCKHTSETKEKISILNIGHKLWSEEAKIHHRLVMFGNKHLLGCVPTAETRQKISESQIGKKQSEETKAKISKSHIGMTYSDETKAKLSAHSATKGGLSKETKEKMRLAHLGKKRPPMSEEQKRKISEARKKLFAKDDHALEI